ncbi:MAG: excinuclease ABC subunit UvrC [Firmicutes bacterium]|nr:excinuclease ABC subunit UvrC [Bacillota bacterium]
MPSFTTFAKDNIARKLSVLPDLPGCYLMKDQAGSVIYIGKALSLKKRVSSYFHGAHDPKTAALLENIVDFETVVVDSEADALILECNLIKEYQPYYNILLRDDKHYPYLCLTLSEPFPRLIVARRTKNDGNKYFGPYASAGQMRYAMRIIRDIFPLRTCLGQTFKVGQRACLNAHIGRCLAPCENRINSTDYGRITEGVQQFLQGKTKELLRRTEQDMLQASHDLRFEEAARLRDALSALNKVQHQQQLDQRDVKGYYDVIAIACGETLSVIQVFFVRQGKVVGREHFFMSNVLAYDTNDTEHIATLLRRFLQEYYGGGDFMPRYIYSEFLPEDSELLQQIFHDRYGHKVEIIKPQRGDKMRLIGLVKQNAQLTLDQHLNSRERKEQRAAAGLEQLRQELQLRHAPSRMECYDISHIQGAYMVGSMAVFINGVPTPKNYRRFKIKTLDSSNDFAALQEVIERRIKRGLAERRERKQPLDYGNFPDLVVIDGGKGQLSAVCLRLQELGEMNFDIIALAKEEEEIFMPHHLTAIRLPYESPGLQLLQGLRDEAHRFAITYHRKLRGKGQTASLLDMAPGIGPKRRASLLKSFGSIKAIQKAAVEELAAAPTMNKACAATLYEWLKNNN